MVLENCPWVERPDYLDANCEARYVDFLELYCGKGRLVGMVSKAGLFFQRSFTTDCFY